MFNPLSEDAEKLLEELLVSNDPQLLTEEKFKAFETKFEEDLYLRKLYQKLKDNGILFFNWADNIAFGVQVLIPATKYFKEKQESKTGKFDNLEMLIFEILFQYKKAGLSSDNLTLECNIKFLDMPGSSRKELFEKLKKMNLISYFSLDGQRKAKVILEPSIFTYFDEKEKHIEEQESQKASRHTFYIGTLNANGSNFVLGNVFDTSFNIDNSIHTIEKQIDENGDTEKEELRQLLKEAEEIINNIKSSRSIPQNKGFFEKLSTHLSKHGWFYSAIVGLLGEAGLSLLGM